jgi:regulator of protease activity HflC (stomatin/prohibitin superfamily)
MTTMTAIAAAEVDKMIELIVPVSLAIVALFIIIKSIVIVRPFERGLIERLGKYNRFAEPGLNFVIPLIESGTIVNITEMMVDAGRQEIITKDKLNAGVDAQVYFKIYDDEKSVKASVYNVYNCKSQIVNLARTTLRNIVGTMTLNSANSDRDKINSELMKTLSTETKNWGICVVRTELKEIEPPKDVQETMNKVVEAENEKQAAVDYATATETVADGDRRAQIKVAEGARQASILKAEGEAQAIKLVNEAAEKYFKGNAQTLKKLETVRDSLRDNAKIVVNSDNELINVIGDMAGVPLIKRKDK